MTDSTTDTLNWRAFIDSPGKPLLVSLKHQKLLTATGPDSVKFLQGQVTSDMRHLDKAEFVLGAHCDHKGRMHSSFVAAKSGDSGVGLRVHSSIAESARAALQKYIVFSKAELALTSDTHLFALIGADAHKVLTTHLRSVPTEDGHFAQEQGLTVLRHSENHIELWVSADRADSLQQTLATSCTPATEEQWDLTQIALGLGQIREETVGEFIPQMLNFQQIGGISFNKGCYTGQEVVARMHYLGKLKKHMYLGLAPVPDVPPPGTPIYHGESDVAAGQLVMAAPAGDNEVALLLVCSEQAANTASLTLAKSTGAKIRLQPLPYSLD